MSSFLNDIICYKAVFEHIPAAGFIGVLKERSDVEIDDFYFNKAYVQKFNTIGMDFFSDDILRNRLDTAIKECLDSSTSQSFEYYIKNGTDFIYIKIIIDLMTIEHTELIIGMIEDVSEQVNIKIKMNKQHKELEALNYELTSSKILIDRYIPMSMTNLDGVITECNEAFCNLTGYKKEEMLGKKHNILKDYETPEKVYKNFWHVIVNNETYIGELKNRKKDGTPFWIRTRVHPKYEKDGTKIGYIAVREDITHTKQLEEKASVDSLTRVFSRDKFNDFLIQGLAEYQRYSKLSSLIVCDIDHFKSVNDRYGHLIGDEVLKEVAAVLGKTIRNSDILARWGGEEFVILLPNTSEENAAYVANKIVDAVENNRFGVVGNVTVSCGVSEVSQNDTLDIWFKRADDALYQAKENGRNAVVCI